MSHSQFRALRRSPGFKAYMREALEDELNDPVANLLIAKELKRAAIEEGDTTAAKMRFQMQQTYAPVVPKSFTVEDTQSTVSQLSDDELERLTALYPMSLKETVRGAGDEDD